MESLDKTSVMLLGVAVVLLAMLIADLYEQLDHERRYTRALDSDLVKMLADFEDKHRAKNSVSDL